MTHGQNIVVVIRTSGERTFDVCKALVLEQISDKQVHVVSEQPFEAALRRCYQIGLDSGAKWMMTLDADVLLREGAIEQLLSHAEKLPRRFFQVEGMAHDKLMGLNRKVGHRIYRTEHLHLALGQIPVEGREIRPERTSLSNMERLGYLSFRIDLIVGIHDYEQFYRDIYRKAYIHANKHQTWLPSLVERWKAMAHKDADFRVALRGLYDGLMSLSQPRIDIRDYTDGAENALNQLGLIEKTDLDLTSVDSRTVAGVLSNARSVATRKETRIHEPITARLKKRVLRPGIVRAAVHKVGILLIVVGAKISQMANFGRRS